MYTQHPMLTEKNRHVEVFANFLKKNKLVFAWFITFEYDICFFAANGCNAWVTYVFQYRADLNNHIWCF